jgi:uncharacterized protein (TIGR02996 family)
MTTDDGIFQAILDNPDDDHLRLVYADWLDDHGDSARAEFIRVQIALADAQGATRADLHAREQWLRSAFENEWTAPLHRLVSRWDFRRGFVDEVRVEARAFADRADELFRLAPLQRVALYWRADPPHERARFVSVLTACPHLRRLHTLDLSDGYLGSVGVQALAVCEHFTRLTNLNLSGNRIGPSGARALTDAPFLDQLTDLDLSRNDLGPGAIRSLSAALRARLEADQSVQLRTLDLTGNPLGAAGVREVLNCPVLRRVARYGEKDIS